MHTFYLNIPWIIDEKEYNCSSRLLAEWKAQGAINLKQGVYFLTTGVIYVSIYVLSLIGMFRGKLLHISCYRLMFFNGFLDIMDIMAGSLAVSYLHFTGSVFCSNEPLNIFLGHLVWSLWMGVSVMCAALATNRVVEMIPSMRRDVYVWMVISVGVCIVRPFVSRPMLFNSSVAAFIFAPVTTGNITSEIDHYTSLLFPIHNILFPSTLGVLYSVLCFYVFKIRISTNGKIDKLQLQLFIQSLAICTSAAVASTFYVLVEFLPVTGCIVLISNVMWQLTHGIHGVVYIAVNRTVRGEVLRLLGINGKRRTAANIVSALSAKK